VDSGIEVNYIKRKLALEISIIVILRVTPLVVLDKSQIYSYKDYVLGVTTKDTISDRREANIYFVSCDFNLRV